MNREFATPFNHINFLAKKLFGGVGEIIDGSIAYIEEGGGGPVEKHKHEHCHLFIVVSGQAKILLEDNKEVLVNENESYIVESNQIHSVWNNTNKTMVMIGISLKKK